MIKKNWSKIMGYLSQEQGHDSIVTPVNEEGEFDLYYNELEIGRLTVQDGSWKFVYSDDFKNQSEISTLIDFPILEKKYESDVLWPFFSIRIPSLAQPSVQKILEQENIDEENTVKLLKRFGRKVIANPFILAPAA